MELCEARNILILQPLEKIKELKCDMSRLWKSLQINTVLVLHSHKLSMTSSSAILKPKVIFSHVWLLISQRKKKFKSNFLFCSIV